MREELLGYLLGALDADEQAQVEERLRNDPRLRRELEQLRRLTEPLEDAYADVDPPPGLARRTMAALDCQQGEKVERASPGRHLRRADTTTTIVASVVLAAMLFPVLLNSRYMSQIEDCQWRLRELGTRLISYASTQADRSYPLVEPSGKLSFSGYNAVVLRQQGYLEPRSTLVLCPSAGKDVAQWLGIPTPQEVLTADGERLEALQRQAGGDYGWGLGFVENGEYRAPQYRGRSHFVIVSDAPSLFLPNLASTNHAGRGWNVLYDDQRVAFVKACRGRACPDDPLRNHFGLVAPGVGEDDSVIAASNIRPFPDRQAK